MKASGMDVLSMDVYPRCFYSRRVYNEVSILQVRLWIVFVKRKCEQKGPKKVSTFSTRFHVVSNVFPKYQMLTF